MGKWYVVEVLQHREDPLKPQSGTHVVDMCPVVMMKSFDYSTLKLVWSEEAGSVEYTFRIPDITKRKGFWRATNPQNGKISSIFA